VINALIEENEKTILEEQNAKKIELKHRENKKPIYGQSSSSKKGFGSSCFFLYSR